MRWPWVLLAVLSNVLVFLLQGWRWKLLLNPIQRVPFTQAVQAIYVGLFANEVLPLRAGELIRCFLLSKTSGIPVSVSFASALIERIFDGIWLMGCFFFCLYLGKLPGVLLNSRYHHCALRRHLGLCHVCQKAVDRSVLQDALAALV